MKRILAYIKYMSYVGIISCFLGCIYDGPYEMVPSLTPLREISCSTVNIDFGYYEPSKTISITVKGYETNWSISGAPDWLTITPQSGYSVGDSDVKISVTANPSAESTRS